MSGPGSFFKLAHRFKGIGAKVGFAFGLSKYIRPLGREYTQKARTLLDELHEAIPGSPEYNAVLTKLQSLGDAHEIHKLLVDGGVAYSADVMNDMHFYHLARMFEISQLNAGKTIEDPKLIYHYLLSLPGVAGVIMPEEKEVLDKLDNALTADYLEHLKTELVKKAYERGEKVLRERSEQGEGPPKGMRVIIVNDMVVLVAHVMDKNSQSILLKTIQGKHAFAQGDSLHQFWIKGDILHFSNYGRGQSGVPFGNTMNNVVAVPMWSLSSLLGILNYMAEVAGKNNIAEWLVKEKISEFAVAAERLQLLGHFSGWFKLAAVNYFTVDPAKEAQARKGFQEAYNLKIETMKSITSLVINVTTREEGVKASEPFMGKRELNPKDWFAPPKDAVQGSADFKDAGLYSGQNRIIYPNFILGNDTLIESAKPNPAWQDSTNQLMVEKVGTLMTAQKVIEFRQLYQEEVARAIDQLPADMRADKQALSAALESNLTLKVLVEEHLNSYRDMVAPGIADALIKQEKINLVQHSIPNILANVRSVFHTKVLETFQEGGGLVETWTIHALEQYLITPTAEQLLEDRKQHLTTEHDVRYDALNQFRHTQGEKALKENKELKEEEKRLEERWKESKEMVEHHQKDMDDIKEVKKEWHEREEKREKREVELRDHLFTKK